MISLFIHLRFGASRAGIRLSCSADNNGRQERATTFTHSLFQRSIMSSSKGLRRYILGMYFLRSTLSVFLLSSKQRADVLVPVGHSDS